MTKEQAIRRLTKERIAIVAAISVGSLALSTGIPQYYVSYAKANLGARARDFNPMFKQKAVDYIKQRKETMKRAQDMIDKGLLLPNESKVADLIGYVSDGVFYLR